MTLFLPFLLLVEVAASTNPASSTPAAKQALGSAIGDVLRGEGSAARTRLRSIPDDQLSQKDSLFRTCALSRLSDAPSESTLRGIGASTPFVRKLLTLYRTYWRVGAIDEAARPAAEKSLLAGLSQLLRQPSLKSVEDAEPLIASRLRATKLFSQEGRTGVFHDLMIWSSQTQRVENVPLPEGSNATQVNYLDGFLSRGWSSYFTCDRTGTGGWTTLDGLFVIVPSYDSLTDETFRVNFLAHESQHYSDKKRFGKLPGWRLEYRAKLVELTYAETTRDRVLNSFSNNQGDDPEDPHSYADKKVLGALTRRLGLSSIEELHTVPLPRLHQAAVDELKADSQQLAATGQPATPGTATGVKN